MVQQVLYSFRSFHNWETKDIAGKLAISVEEYKDLESGIDKVDAKTAAKLSELYQAPVQFFLCNNFFGHFPITYMHCNFENSNGYVNHLYQQDEQLSKKNETIELLKVELKRLHELNRELVGILGRH